MLDARLLAGPEIHFALGQRDFVGTLRMHSSCGAASALWSRPLNRPDHTINLAPDVFGAMALREKASSVSAKSAGSNPCNVDGHKNRPNG